jgi:hypothetical protein
MKRAIVLSILLAVVAGCGPKKPEMTGFLSDYSKLKKVSDSTLRYVNEKAAGKYSSFIVDPVQVRFYSGSPSEGKLTMQQLSDLTNYMHLKIVEAVQGAGDTVVEQPGPGVARVRVALSDIKKASALAILPQANLLGGGVGGASMEAEVVDSMTGKQIAAVVQSGMGSRIPFTNLGDLSSAKNVIDGWAKTFEKRLIELKQTK